MKKKEEKIALVSAFVQSLMKIVQVVFYVSYNPILNQYDCLMFTIYLLNTKFWKWFQFLLFSIFDDRLTLPLMCDQDSNILQNLNYYKMYSMGLQCGCLFILVIHECVIPKAILTCENIYKTTLRNMPVYFESLCEKEGTGSKGEERR